eukprot:gene6250-2875_t
MARVRSSRRDTPFPLPALWSARASKVALLVVAVVLSLTPCYHAMTTNGDKILNQLGETVELKGANWFGFNNGATMVDGMWNPSNGMSYDLRPSSTAGSFWASTPSGCPSPLSIEYYCTSANTRHHNCLQADIAASVVNIPADAAPPPPYCVNADIAASVVKPGVNILANAAPPPPAAYAVHQPSNSCNSYLPANSVLDRFVWVVQYLANNGFYVLRWADIVARISNDPVAANALMIDILNEPDNYGVKWPQLKWQLLTDMWRWPTRMTRGHRPAGLSFNLTGTGQGGNGANWGDGFATDQVSLNIVGENGNPRPFFDALFSKPYLNQVVISPHVYGPGVTNEGSNFAGAGLYNRLSTSFGYLTSEGYTSSSNGQTKLFPIAIGEFGSKFTDANDILFMIDFAKYLNGKGAAADGRHKSIGNWFYWCWNDNSGDTGGLIDSSWVNILWNKIQYLESIGLEPWYNNTVVRYAANTAWKQGSSWSNSVNFYITQVGGDSTIPKPWTLEVGNPSFVGKGGVWNMNVISIAKGVLTAQATQNWQALQANMGNEVSMGLILKSSGSEVADFIPLWAKDAVHVRHLLGSCLTVQAAQNWQAMQANMGNAVSMGPILKSSGSEVADFIPLWAKVNSMKCSVEALPV